jgi:hypothetical protein
MRVVDQVAAFVILLALVLGGFLSWAVLKGDPLYRCVEERVVQVGLCRSPEGHVCQVFVEGGKTAWSAAKPGEMAKVCEEVEP